MKLITSLIILLTLFLSERNKDSIHLAAKQNDSSKFIHPFTLTSIASKPTLFKDGTPFVFIEFINPDSVYGYQAVYPYKGKVGYAEQWLFNLKKITNSTYKGEYVHMSHFEKVPIDVFNDHGTWFYKYGAFKPVELKPISDGEFKDTTRNQVYLESLLNFKYYSVGISNEQIGAYTYNKYRYNNPIYKMPFADFSKKVNSLSIKELQHILTIDTL